MKEEVVQFSNRHGRRIVGTLLTPDTQQRVPAVLVIHGFRGNRGERHIAAVSQTLSDAGIISLGVDLTNNLGDSEGDFRELTATGSLEDIEDSLAYLQKRSEVDLERLGVVGHSFGGMLAAITAARTPTLMSLVTLSAVFAMPKSLTSFLGEEQVRSWEKLGYIEMDPPGCGLYLNYAFYEDLIRYDVVAEAKLVKTPVRIVQGEADTGVPVEDALLYYKHVASREKDLVLLPGADHGYSRDSDLAQVCRYTADWFERTLCQ